MFRRACLVGVIVAFCCSATRAEDPVDLSVQAADALRRASNFFTQAVATEGGYLWRYSEDLQFREGEGRASKTIVWVQPPGTPSVGMAFLTAYEATGNTC